MKKYIRNPKFMILIEIILNDNINTITSYEYVKRYDNIDPEHQYTPEQISALNDFIHTVLSVIRSRDFEIKKKYQSTDSYSYYIYFKPEFYEGVDAEVINVKFKIGDHNPIEEEFTDEDKELAIFHTILINKEEYEDWMQIIQNIRSICDEIKAGDYSSLLPNK